MYYNDISCLVIGSMDMRENDKYITVLTDSLGKIRINAKGVTGRQKGLLASTQLFAFSKCTLFENKGYYNMNSAEPIYQFFDLSKDFSKLSLASYFLEVVNHVTFGDMDCADILKLTVAALKMLSKDNADERLIKSAFELKMACLCGFCPDIRRCVRCGRAPSETVFDTLSSSVFCGKCVGNYDDNTFVKLTAGALQAADFIINMPIHKIFSFSLNECSAKCLAKMSELYLLNKIEHKFETLEFYKKYCNFTIPQ